MCAENNCSHEENSNETGGLKCEVCGGALSFGPKGLTCPRCDTPKEMVVKRAIFGFKLVSAKNVFTNKVLFSAEELEQFHQRGVTITVEY